MYRDSFSINCINASKVLFKLDEKGNGLAISASDIGSDKQNWNQTKTRHLCILSGCDYLDSLSGVGLSKAEKCLIQYKDGYAVRSLFLLDSNAQTLRKWRDLGKMINAPKVPKEYEVAFRKAELTFLHQRVFDPIKKEIVYLTPLKDVDDIETVEEFLGRCAYTSSLYKRLTYQSHS